jgi:hypothetical protein
MGSIFFASVSEESSAAATSSRINGSTVALQINDR